MTSIASITLAATLVSYAGLTTLAQETTTTSVVKESAKSRDLQLAGSGPGAPAPGPAFADRLQSIISRAYGAPNPPGALVVFSSKPDATSQGRLQEDLAVMSHILDKVIDDSLGSDARMKKAMGVDLVFAPDSNMPRKGYLQGYGAFFLLNVAFPLLPPPPKTETQKEEPPMSSAWEEARQEVLGGPPGPGSGPSPAAEPYNEEKVNRLKSGLIEALKNVANIRDLKPDEGVTVCVFGGAKPLARAVSSTGTPGTVAATGQIATLGVNTSSAGLQRGTVLTIRVMKSSIDAFAKGQMNLDEFQQKAAITTYEGEPEGGVPAGRYGGGRYGAGGYGGAGGGYGGFGGGYGGNR
jgi:hypothetical protein